MAYSLFHCGWLLFCLKFFIAKEDLLQHWYIVLVITVKWWKVIYCKSVDVQSLCKFKASSQDQWCLQLFFTQCTSLCWHICSETTKDSNANVAWSLLECSSLYYHIIHCKNEKILKAPFRVFQIYTLVELLGTLWRLKYSTVHSRNFNIFPLFVSKPFPYDLVLLEKLLIVFIEFLKKFMDSILFLIPPFHQNGAV